MALERHTFELRGTVQGVGFRPALFRHATEAGLGGSVQNRSGAVRLVLEGTSTAIGSFLDQLGDALPPQADVTDTRCLDRRPLDGTVPTPFTIIESESDGDRRVSIPVDLGICAHCAAEINDPEDRHFRYAFTSCTNCGPRYTVIEAMPYDRERTSLREFPLCPECEREYTDPANRRFHAESTCCPECGPQLDYRDQLGRPIEGDPLRMARHDLADGCIIAVRGVGGFLLAVDAYNEKALARLRVLKDRPHKPFAVMARNMDVARKTAYVPDEAAALLESQRRPIVILESRHQAGPLPLSQITPDANTLGIMLPAAPLYHLLMSDPADPGLPPFDLLVMTSGNRRGEPICIQNVEALNRLHGIADRFLLHDREVVLRNDDSLCALQSNVRQVWRRARGYAPATIRVGNPITKPVLAMGAHLKNAIAIGYDDEVVFSPHIGDLDTPEAVDGLREAMDVLPRFLGRDPEAVAVDLHPDLQSTRIGKAFADKHGLPVTEVQHHHAHALSCMAEHGLTSALALVFDGTGLGTDGTIWGAELLHVHDGGYERIGSFKPVPLPGGDAAVRQPSRQLLGRWFDAGILPDSSQVHRLGLSHETTHVIAQQIHNQVNAPMSTAAGRVFDAFSTWLGLPPDKVTYDGQAAVRLEAMAGRMDNRLLPMLPVPGEYHSNGHIEIDWEPLFSELAPLPAPDEADKPAWAMAFHIRMAEAAVTMVRNAYDLELKLPVCLSGGVFMNRLLCHHVTAMLEAEGAQVLIHRMVPPNDGGIALGQAVYSARQAFHK